jgi:hypothetical protein
MRTPSFENDGWCLEDGEQRHLEAPTKFFIPELALRQILQPGDLAKLVFRIALYDDDDTEAYERMWVIVRERIDGGYIGMLDNEPTSIEQNDSFWRGSELPFEPKHIIAVDHANEATHALVKQPPAIPWDRG